MRARVAAAAGGAAVWSLVAGGGLVASPWRPGGVAVALALLLVVVPAAAGLGAATGLRTTGQDAVGAAARLAALGAPVVVLLVLFALRSAAPAGDEAAQQLVALAVGAPAAAGLAARFTGSAAEAGAETPGP